MSLSRPVYAPFGLDLSGRAHLIVTDQPAPPAGADLTLAEAWTVATSGPGLAAASAPGVRPFRAVADLLAQLTHRLARAQVGLRLYAVGSEAFIWDAHNIGQQAGLGRAEMFLTRAGRLTRRVCCVHCKTMIQEVQHTVTPCPGCGAALEVRDHFSRRLAAFIGVRVDAEVPGEVPAAELFAS